MRSLGRQDARSLLGTSGMGIALILAGWLAGPVRGDDWPQWLGPKRDGVWRETGILEKFPEGGPKVLWRTPIAAGYAGPAVANGRVFVTDRVLAPGAKNPANAFQRDKIPGTERVLCINAADGQIVWKHEYDCPYTISYPLGPRTTPLIHDGRVYTLGAMGNLLCLDEGTGQEIWSKDLKKEYGIPAPMWGFSAHPLLDGQKLICMVGGQGSTVVAFNKDTGKEIWKALSAKEPGYCPPVIIEAGGKRQLIAWHAEAVNGLDPETGSVYWSVPIDSYSGMAIATPRQAGDHLFITGAMKTAVMLQLDSAKPAAKVAWRGNKNTGIFSVFATPFIDGDVVYGSSGGETALVAMKLADGQHLWETRAPNNNEALRSGDIFVIKNGDRYFLANEKGDLIIARLSPKGYEEISRAHLLDPTSSSWGRNVLWSHPAFANRCVYLRNDKEIVCVSLAANGS